MNKRMSIPPPTIYTVFRKKTYCVSSHDSQKNWPIWMKVQDKIANWNVVSKSIKITCIFAKYSLLAAIEQDVSKSAVIQQWDLHWRQTWMFVKNCIEKRFSRCIWQYEVLMGKDTDQVISARSFITLLIFAVEWALCGRPQPEYESMLPLPSFSPLNVLKLYHL